MSDQGSRTAGRQSTHRRKGPAFTEMLSIFLKQDYSYPVLEIFAFLFAVGILISTSSLQGYNTTYLAYSYLGMGGAVGLPILVFMILIWKNISFGLGGDLEKGLMQTFLTYPLSRRRLLGARLLSSVGVAVGILSLAELAVILIMMPGLASQQASTLLLNYLSVLATPILITMIVLLVCVLAKSSGVPLLIGIVSYFFVGLFVNLFVGVAGQTKDAALLGLTYLLNPAIALQSYYNFNFNDGSTGFFSSTWGIPGFEATLVYLVGNYAISVILLAAGVFWFARKLEL